MAFWEAVRLALQTIRAQKLKSAFSVMRGVTVPVLAAWESSTRTTLVAGHRHAKDVEVTAATELYFDIRSLAVERGRPFTGQEVQAGVPVLVLGYELAEKLFEGQDPLGREVKIFDLPYRVIGVVEKQGNLFGLSLDKFAVAPASAPLKRYVSEPRVVDAVAMKARTQPDMREALGQAEAIMRNRRHLRPRQADDFTLETADESGRLATPPETPEPRSGPTAGQVGRGRRDCARPRFRHGPARVGAGER